MQAARLSIFLERDSSPIRIVIASLLVFHHPAPQLVVTFTSVDQGRLNQFAPSLLHRAKPRHMLNCLIISLQARIARHLTCAAESLSFAAAAVSVALSNVVALLNAPLSCSTAPAR